MLETTIFKPYDQAKHSEEWPQLELKDAIVYQYNRDGPDEVWDLLDVHWSGSLSITGTIVQIPPKFKSMVKDAPTIGKTMKKSRSAAALAASLKGKTITITDVIVYSIESYDGADVDCTIWALGKAGWYSIAPSPEFKEIFQTTLEKANAWDMVLGIGSSAGHTKVTMNQLFKKFAEKYPKYGGVEYSPNMYRKHADYLMCKMLEPPTDKMQKPMKSHWSKFCLFNWLNHAFPDITGRVEAVIQNRKKIPLDYIKKRQFMPRFDLNGVSDGFDALEVTVLERKLGVDELTWDFLVDWLDKKSDANNREETENVLERYSLVLIGSMDSSLQVSWSGSEAYEHLLSFQGGEEGKEEGDAEEEEAHGTATAPCRARGSNDTRSKLANGKAVATPQRSNSKSSRQSRQSRQPIGTNASSAMDLDEDRAASEGPPPCRSSKGKSVLRPVKTPFREPEKPGSPPPSPFSNPGDPSELALRQLVAPGHPATQKRDHSPDSDSVPPKRGRANKQPAACQSSWPPLSANGGRPPVIVRKMIDYGRDKHWYCPQEGCPKIILEANTRAGRKACEEHIGEHAIVAQRAIKAIHSEFGIRPPARVENLLAKIEDMANEWDSAKLAPLEGLRP